MVQVWPGERNGPRTSKLVKKENGKAQLDLIHRIKGGNPTRHIYNDVKTLDSWDHYPFYVVVQCSLELLCKETETMKQKLNSRKRWWIKKTISKKKKP